MTKRALLNLVLLLAVIGLGLVVYLEPGIEQEAREGIPLSELSLETISELTFKAKGQDKVELRREGEQWWLTQSNIRASQFQVERIFELLSAASIKQYSVEGLDLSQYGLASPEVEVFVGRHKFAFGKLSPVGYQRYVMFQNKLHLIDISDLSIFTDGWVELVDLQLLPKQSKLKQLLIPGLGELVYEENGWRFKDKREISSQDALVGLVDAWLHAQAFKVSPYEIGETAKTVTLQLVDKERQIEFKIMKLDDAVLLGREDVGIQYHVSTSQAQRMFELPKSE